MHRSFLVNGKLFIAIHVLNLSDMRQGKNYFTVDIFLHYICGGNIL